MSLKRFITIPWIEQKGDALIKQIEKSGSIELIPITLHNVANQFERGAILSYAFKNPYAFATAIEQKILQIKGPIHGLLLTHDWPTPMAIISQVARDHGIPIFLITHEAIFVEEELYYLNKKTGLNIPSADHVYVWGNLQKEIFTSRGFPEKSISVLGSPKLAKCKSTVVETSSEDFFKALNLPSNRFLVSYIAQHLDNVPNKIYARDQQIKTIEMIHELCLTQDWSFVVRLPPGRSKDVMEGRMLAKWNKGLPFAVIDADLSIPEFDPITHISYSDLLISYSSTMLLEATLLNKSAMILNLDLPPSLLEKNLGLPVALDKSSLYKLALQLSHTKQNIQSETGKIWSQWAFSNGSFNETSVVHKIQESLKKLAIRPAFPYGRAPYFKSLFGYAYFRASIFLTAHFKSLRQRF